jgi:hypothetical protein
MKLRLPTSLTVTTLLAAAGMCLTAAPAVSAATAASKPNLVVTEIKIDLPGTPHYIALGHSGLTPRFLIGLTTKNQGSATAPRSMTAVTLLQGSSKFHKFVKVPSLAPGKEFTKSVTIDPYQPPLGIIKTVAQADYNHGGAELPGGEIVIIARRWDVTTFLTHTTAGGQETSDTSADSGQSGSQLYFSFSKLDESAKKFYYTAKGGITEKWSESGTCSGSGSKDKSLSPWPKSSLWISGTLTSYDSKIASHLAPKFSVTVTCLGGQKLKVPVAFQDLATEKKGSFPAMSPTATTLSGSYSPTKSTKLTWDFTADVP